MQYKLTANCQLANDTTYLIDGVHIRTDITGRDTLTAKRHNPAWEDDDSTCSPWIHSKLKCRKATAEEITAYQKYHGVPFDAEKVGMVRLEMSHTYVPTAAILKAELLPRLGLTGECTQVKTEGLAKVTDSGGKYAGHSINVYRVTDNTLLCQSQNVTYLLTTDVELITAYCAIWDRALASNPMEYYTKRWAEMKADIDKEMAVSAG